jgi:hypothetical protein
LTPFGALTAFYKGHEGAEVAEFFLDLCAENLLEEGDQPLSPAEDQAIQEAIERPVIGLEVGG